MRIRCAAICLFLISFTPLCLAVPEDSGEKEATPSFDTTATAVDQIRVAKGFEVELLYTVPKDKEGSWVNLCTDPRGRLIVSDQTGGLYRITPPAKGAKGETKVEPIPVELGQAQGLLWVGDTLYVMVNGDEQEYASGLYRVTDTSGDDQLDKVELLKEITGYGEHGAHAILLAPDGKWLIIVCGNKVPPIDTVRTRVPPIWDEDALLPRIYGVGFMKGTPAPAGAIYRINFDGTEWERISSGFRNCYDAAFNADGELLTYDADMEWDLGAPWYRPTRVCHVVSGADWGWRVSSAKWPVYYADTLPPVVNIGPGCPTGVTLGYGAKFPAKYQNAMYLCDWTFGKMYAVHLEPQNSTYTGTLEDFVSATPLPLTDVIINPADGAMYFLIGGRGVQSGLYRVTYTGGESTEPADGKLPNANNRELRHSLENLHVGEHADAIEKAWPYLSHSDRFVRYAARTAIEQQPLEKWQQRALDEMDPQASLTALLALVRKIPRSYKPTSDDLDTPPPKFPATDAERHPLQLDVLRAIARFDTKQLTGEQRLELLRLCALTFYRLGPPPEPVRQTIIARLDANYPSDSPEANSMLTELLCYLQAPSAAKKGIALLNAAPTQEGQIDLVRSLRCLEAGWTPELRRAFFEWFNRAGAYKGANNFATFMTELKADAVARLPENERNALAEIIDAPPPQQVTPLSAKPRPLVKEWTKDELASLVTTKLTNRDFDRGRALFAAANCFGCHRFANEGGSVGPDLTSLAGRFSALDILESVVEPNKVISDQYAAVDVLTTDGRVVTGRIVNHGKGRLVINTNMLDPNANENINSAKIDELTISPVSMMPAGLLNTLNEDEVLDLMAFLLSRGNRNDPMFATNPTNLNRTQQRGN
jgi:putative heme-binding domain-containing protein